MSMTQAGHDDAGSHIFRFNDLPAEIRTRIFQAIWHTQNREQNGVIQERTVTSFLCLNEKTYLDFAPEWYRHCAFSFKKPQDIMTKFLMLEPTELCLRNVRHVVITWDERQNSGMLDADTYEMAVGLLSMLPEVARLKTITLIFKFQAESISLWEASLIVGNSLLSGAAWFGAMENRIDFIPGKFRKLFASKFDFDYHGVVGIAKQNGIEQDVIIQVGTTLPQDTVAVQRKEVVVVLTRKETANREVLKPDK